MKEYSAPKIEAIDIDIEESILTVSRPENSGGFGDATDETGE